jgi:MATE family multidrug resistance protein
VTVIGAANIESAATRDILAQAWPMFIAQLAFVANLTIDTAMAGRLSADQLAGVSLGQNIYVSIAVAMLGVLAALGPIAALHFGAGRPQQVGGDLRQALWLAAFLSVPGCALLYSHQPFLQWARPSDPVAHVANAYLVASAVGLPGALGTRVFATLNSALSRPQFTMGINLVALALKIPLNALFIGGVGPIPALGGAGCAVATAVLSWLMFALALACWRWHSSYRGFHLPPLPGSWRPHVQSQKELLRIGIPAGLGTLFEVTSFTMMAVLVARLGAATLSGHQIVGNIAAVLFMVPLSIGFAASALVAQSLGGGQHQRARLLCRRALRLTIAVALTASTLTWLAREPVLGAYTSDPQTALTAHRLIALALVFHVFDALQIVAVFMLRSYRVTAWPMAIYGISLWGIGLGGGYCLAYVGVGSMAPLGAVGLWSAAVLGLGIAALSLSLLVIYVSGQDERDERPGDAQTRGADGPL